MREETRDRRSEEIAEAAYALLAEKGFASTTMLAVAKRAKASNETLYRWYGDKVGLFRSMIGANAAVVSRLLERDLASDRPPLETLADLGPKLLGLLTSDRAIALNRAAAADATGQLGQTLSEAGRLTVGPMIAQVFARAHAAGDLNCPNPRTATGLYLDLLVGDLQIRRAIGVTPQPSVEDIEDRAARAHKHIQQLLAP